ncbi:MAG: hypothetical protein R3208_14045 [Ketobacteraceae bacterium]|nr:hypothetical protein [Ketobacteraceae bacterium]
MPRLQHRLLKRLLFTIAGITLLVSVVVGLIIYHLHTGNDATDLMTSLKGSLNSVHPASSEPPADSSMIKTIGYGVGALILAFLMVVVSSAIHQLMQKEQK